MTKPKVAFLIRGHIRDSLKNNDLNYFLVACLNFVDLDIYIQTWNVSEANKSWRDTSNFNFKKVEESDIYDYFDTCLHPRIKSLLILDETSVNLIGSTDGKIGKSMCPTIGWKYMWSGMYENISKIPEENDYKFAINTRFDILTRGLDNFCRDPIHTEKFIPRTHLDFVRKMIALSKFTKLKYIYSMYDIVGCDNFISGSIDDIKWLITSFHFELDEILTKWTNSNFRLKHQEACVRWFCLMNDKFRFNGIPVNNDIA